MNKEYYQKEYGKRVSKSLNFYGLTEGDLAKLIGSNSTNIKNIISGKVGLNINKMISIASVFGLTYYEFADPDHKFLLKNKLPEFTVKIIDERQGKGIIIRDVSNILAKELDRLIKENVLNKPVTSKGLISLMNPKARERNSTEVTNLLIKEPRSSLIVQLKHKYRNQSLFVHKDYVKKYERMGKEELKILIDEN